MMSCSYLEGQGAKSFGSPVFTGLKSFYSKRFLEFCPLLTEQILKESGWSFESMKGIKVRFRQSE